MIEQKEPSTWNTVRPNPLSPETVLNGRFELESVVGQGGFTIAYLARDLRRDDRCVVLELAPEGCARRGDGRPDLDLFGHAHATRLRQMFVDESRRLSRINSPSIRGTRADFVENGTAYAVVEHVPKAISLSRKLAKEGSLDHQAALDVLMACLAALQKVHAAGMLHLDIRPSSLILSEAGKVYLIGFGGARAWHEESLGIPRKEDDLPYRAPEMSNPKLRRGAATDIYALCAVLYQALAGPPPPEAGLRLEGRVLVSLASVRPDIPRALCDAIMKGLAMALGARPQSTAAFLALIESEREYEEAGEALESFDEKAVRLMSFRFKKRQCMGCGGLLEHVRPLRRNACPVCHEGSVRARKVEPRLCPICRSAPLKKKSNADPIAICPSCRTGLLGRVRKKMFSKSFGYRCVDCNVRFEIEDGKLAMYAAHAPISETVPASVHSLDEWRLISNRSTEFWLCEGCGAQFDVMGDGRLSLKLPEKSVRYSALYPLEWAHVAAGLPPYAGNAECDACGADFELRDGQMTLLSATQDPYGFAEGYLGRSMTIEDARWLGVGKMSEHPGWVCGDCGTELDDDGELLRLVQTGKPELMSRIGDELSLEDWNRAAQSLPLTAEEEDFEADFDRAMVEAFVSGRSSLAAKKGRELIWRSRTRWLVLGREGWVDRGARRLEISTAGFVFGNRLRKRQIPLGNIRRVYADGDRLVLEMEDASKPVAFEIPETSVSTKLKSGVRRVALGAPELAERLNWHLGKSG